VVVDGRPMAAYANAYVADGRVYAAVAPLLMRLADRTWFEGDTLVIERDGRRVRVRLPAGAPVQLDGAFVAVGPVLRALGASASYEPQSRRLSVRTRAAAVASPTPYNAATPLVAPAPVFTVVPISAPRPVWTGSPLPRRTPLPLPPPRD
jgi:hypothetical protein